MEIKIKKSFLENQNTIKRTNHKLIKAMEQKAALKKNGITIILKTIH